MVEELVLKFYPAQGTRGKKIAARSMEQEKVHMLSDIAKKVKEELAASGITSWEITLEGYLEASSGALPGGKAGFKAVLKLSNK